MATSTNSPSVGTHWTDQRLAQNLLNASRARELDKAAAEWKLSRITCSPVPIRCQFCNMKINWCVLLSNTVNGNHVIIGQDCYDKFLQFLREGKIESALPPRGAHSKALRSYWKGLINALPDQTVIGWLNDEFSAGRLTGVVAKVMYTITRLGFAPTTTDADLVIAYYKATRQFPLKILFSVYRLEGFRYRRWLPRKISIDDMSWIKKLIEDDEVARNRLRAAKISEGIARRQAQDAEYARAQQVEWEKTSAKIFALIDSQEQRLSSLGNEPEIVTARHELSMIRKRVTGANRFSARGFISQWIHEHEWLAAKSEMVFFILDKGEKFVLIKNGDRWQEYDHFELQLTPGLRHETGVYRARICGEGQNLLVFLAEKLDSRDRLVEINFSVPSSRRPGTYVGFYGSKVVLPIEPLRKPETCKAFLLNDTGSYYRAWVV